MNDESDHIRLVLIEGQLADLAVRVEEQTKVTRDLVEAWQSAKTLVSFIRLLASIAVAGAVLIAVLKIPLMKIGIL